MGIYGFSLIRNFPYMFLDSVYIRENVAHRKPLYLHILCRVEVSLLVNLYITFSWNTLDFVHEVTNLHLAVRFFLQ